MRIACLRLVCHRAVGSQQKADEPFPCAPMSRREPSSLARPCFYLDWLSSSGEFHHVAPQGRARHIALFASVPSALLLHHRRPLLRLACRLCLRGVQADESSDLALPGGSRRSDISTVESVVTRGLDDHRPNGCSLDSTWKASPRSVSLKTYPLHPTERRGCSHAGQWSYNQTVEM